ncbi:MAG: SpoIID/LytB domain-containing protein [Nitrospirae bacterium]|nr:SpoIID/LytB domain-containing protein [Nitrospirota bacterium]
MKFKNTITVVMLGLTIAMVGVFGQQTTVKETQVKTIHQELNIKIDSKTAAYEPLLIAPYKTMDVFLSNVEEPGFEFTAIGGSYTETKPNGTNIELEVKFEVDGEWTDWIEVEGEDSNGEKVAMAATNPATAMQYRFMLYGDGITSPSIKSIDWSFINTAKSANIEEIPQPKYSALSAVSNATNQVLTSSNDPAGIISRKEWGAKESYRYLASNDADPVLVEIDDSVYEQFADELRYSRVVEEDEYGDTYKWPLQYPEKVKKIIIHHTATTKNLSDPKQAIRDIYYYHTVTKGWGDIGYNYIIDTKGNIYEGRYGGEGVVGAHAGLANTGSIGIAVLGNYDTSSVPEVAVQALGKLISIKSKIHGIDPEGYSTFRGQNMPNIFGHKDVMNTSCPGAYLYEKFPVIRAIAASYVEEKPRFVKDYDFQDRSEIFYEELKPSETITLKFKLENIGNENWSGSTMLVIDKDPSLDNVLSFPGKTTIVSASMREDLVKPGETGTFYLQIKGGSKGEMVYMESYLVVNGSKKLDDAITVPIYVQQSDFKYGFISAYYPDKAMNKGEVFAGWVKLKNTGNVIWNNSGENTVMLGTDHERDRESDFDATTPARIGYLVGDEVLPGETGKFELKLTAPQEPGYYKEYFTPVVEGVTWMADTGMYFETTVYGDLYAAEHVSTTAASEWQKGKKYLVIVKLRNLGQKAWNKDNFKIDLLKELDLNITDAQLMSKEVEPGEIGTISFIAKVADDEGYGSKTILFRPKVDGNKLFRTYIKIPYEVVDEKFVPTYAPDYTPEETGDDIRIKLTFDADPEITASGSYELYNNATLLRSMSSGETATVTQTSDGLKVSTPDNTYSGLNKIRFIPKTGSILQLENKSGDNKYRGILEIREDDGGIIVINELPLEHYLQGLAEEPNDEEYEKIKAIIVAARSYALHYMTDAEKFPGKPYNLSDDPATSQKYNGYSYEMRVPNVVKAVKETAGEVVYYNGNLVKTPYFSQSDGKYTKSAKDVWNWDAGFLVPVSDSYCDADAFWGHGVGLSGCGAKGMAEAGYDYKAILKHYYTGVEIKDLY